MAAQRMHPATCLLLPSPRSQAQRAGDRESGQGVLGLWAAVPRWVITRALGLLSPGVSMTLFKLHVTHRRRAERGGQGLHQAEGLEPQLPATHRRKGRPEAQPGLPTGCLGPQPAGPGHRVSLQGPRPGLDQPLRTGTGVPTAPATPGPSLLPPRAQHTWVAPAFVALCHPPPGLCHPSPRGVSSPPCGCV